MKFIMLDDSQEDSLLFENAIKENDTENDFEVIHRFKCAVKYINETELNSPSLLFIDINFPDGDGHELLKRVISKHKDNPNVIPIMLSTSKNTTDIQKSRSNGAFTYVVKPEGYRDWINMVNKSFDYWKNINEFPKNT